MSAFFGYITNITYYLLFAALANMLAPAGKYRKFVALVTGFVLVMIVLAPLRGIGRDFDAAEFFAGVAGLPAVQGAFPQGEYARLHDTRLMAAFEEQLAIQLEAMLKRNNFTLYEASFSYTEDFSRITAVQAAVSREEESRRVPFIRIEPVQINRGQSEPESDPIAEEAKSLIADFYNLSREHIHVITRKR
ncbi:MAG: stage III sporulation protein AF [Defluviitaleaceae bacterium]|nr:stage III sporulation protein AF [Defluviitaleaceae bacterium]